MGVPGEIMISRFVVHQHWKHLALLTDSAIQASYSQSESWRKLNMQHKVRLHVYNILRKKDGCDWEGELRHLEHHQMEECGWALVKCCYECGVCVPRPQLVEHELHLCPKRPVDVQCKIYANNCMC